MQSKFSQIQSNFSQYSANILLGVLIDRKVFSLVFDILGEDGSGALPSGGGFEFGVDPNEDPELALALRVSMEEQRARQEAESAATGPAEGQPAAETPAEAEDDPVLARALAMSVDQAESGQKTPDLSAMTEDEQIAYAMRMSMQEDASTPTQAEAGGEKMEVDEEAGDKNEDDYSEAMNDPAFLQV